jgi:hypothetical protein
MKKTEFWKDDFSINELNRNLEKSQKIARAIVGKFSELGIEITDIHQLSGLVDNRRKLVDEKLENFVFDQLFPDTPAGFKRDKYREMVQLPDLSAIKESFEPLLGYFGGLFLTDVIYWQVFSIEKGEVEIIDSEQQKLSSKFQEFAETQIEYDRLTAVQDVCNSLNNLVKYAADHPANYVVKGVVTFDESQKKFVPARLFVKNGSVSFAQITYNQNKPDNIKSSPVGKEQVNIAADASDADRGVEFAKSRNS